MLKAVAVVVGRLDADFSAAVQWQDAKALIFD